MLPICEEANCGITQYVCPDVQGFSAVLKQRYSDFIVHELDEDGVMCQLTDAPGLQDQVAPRKSGDPCQAQEEPQMDDAMLAKEGTEALASEIGGEESAKLLLEWITGHLNRTEGLPKYFDIACTASLDKDGRKRMHGLFRASQLYGIVETLTGIEPGPPEVKTVRVEMVSRSSRQKRKRGEVWGMNGREAWPADRPPYLKFVLFKENEDTMRSAGKLCKALSLKRGFLSYAGTKDKRGVTSQWCTIYKKSIEQVNTLYKRGLAGCRANTLLGNFSYVDKELRLGDLAGNHFTIVLRNACFAKGDNDGKASEAVPELENVIAAACESVASVGFLNYFGLQRFGSGGGGTHHVGAALAKRDWSKAVDLIMRPREGEFNSVHQAKVQYLKDPTNAHEALRLMPPGSSDGEVTILAALKRNGPGTYLKALQSMPRLLLLMYMHALQSYIFNRAVSFRAERYGADKVVAGDLVKLTDTECDDEALDDIITAGGDDAAAVAGAADPRQATTDGKEPGEGKGEAMEVEEESAGEKGKDSILMTKVHVVTQEEVESGKYTVYDVVLPMAGFAVELPTNEVGQFYISALEELGLTLADLKCKEYSVFSLKGGYRHMRKSLEGFEWSIKGYDDPCRQLVPTDRDKLMEANASDPPAGNGQENGSLKSDENTKSEAKAEAEADYKFKAVCLSFKLPMGTYATMALREVMKQSTSTAHHTSLNQTKFLSKYGPSSSCNEGARKDVGEAETAANAEGANADASTEDSKVEVAETKAEAEVVVEAA
ncbi:unnamed protein product [Chrysoparadoxa australica]